MFPTTPSHVAEIKDPGFMSTTFGFFALALLITAGGTFSGLYLMSSNPAVFANPLIFYGAVITELILVFTSHAWSRNLPFGYGMFSLFAFLSGFTLVPILVFAGAAGGAALIVKALISSVSVFAAAALYGWVTHRNLQGMGGFLMMALVGVIIMSILGIFFPWNNSMEIGVSGFTILLFAGFTMYDVQRLQRSEVLNPLMAAISLYLNFINLFTSMLRLLSALNRD
ncbi:MAG: Bax inhibitor-1 family protein [Candidatus Altimarinota bacterium]